MREYVNELKEVLDGLNLDKVQEAIELIDSVNDEPETNLILTCGNGGSAATASHLVCDLTKNALNCMGVCLNDSIPLLTAWSNDVSYMASFRNQIDRWMYWCGVLIAISTSGNSPNIVEAAKLAKQYRPVIALTGNDGGELGKIADIEIRVPSDRIQIIEDVHLSICHMIAVGLGA